MDVFKSEDELKELKESWLKEQHNLKIGLVLNDIEPWQIERKLELVGAMDISFLKENPLIACCTLVVCNIPQLKVIYEDSQMVEMSIPYMPGFLAFREVPSCLNLFRKLKEHHPEMVPQVLLFDGNGILHPQGIGMASHFGVVANVCTVGVAKNLHLLDYIKTDKKHLSESGSLKQPGDFFTLEDENGSKIGVALKTCHNAKRPVYVSVGHRISLETAIWTVMQCTCNFRIPEPIRQADIRSRCHVRKQTA